MPRKAVLPRLTSLRPVRLLAPASAPSSRKPPLDASSSTSVNLLSSGPPLSARALPPLPLASAGSLPGMPSLPLGKKKNKNKNKNVLIPQKHNSNASSSKKPSHISLIGLHSQPLPLLSKLLHSLCALRAEAVDLRPRGTPGDSVRRPPLASLPPACVPRGGAVLAPRQPTARADRCLLRCVIHARIS